MGFQGIEAALEDIGAHALGQLVGFLGGCVEAGGPLGIGPVAIGDAAELQRRRVIGERLRRLEDGVADEEFLVGEVDELFAQARTAHQLEVAHAANRRGVFPVFDVALHHARVPGW